MNIRNFCIIAHIDHWKSTLADRMLELTWTIQKSHNSQVLDKMELEQERWITIKLTPARMNYKWYQLNLIDTPGHVDFQYEVSRSLAAVEWAILLVDASQWIQAQTLSNLYMALDQGLEIIPVLNKIDLPAANPERFAAEIEKLVGIPKERVIWVSAKTWLNVEQVLDAIIENIPSPKEFKEFYPEKFWVQKIEWRALIYDSVFDKYKWVITFVKIVDWSLKVWDKIKLVNTWTFFEINEVWFFAPDMKKDKILNTWEIGYIITGQKTVSETKIWDTICKVENKNDNIDLYQIPGFKTVKPFVYAWVYPIETDEYENLKDAVQKLALNDSALEYSYENSKALWFGFRCGFLGMLHMDIIKERLSREYWVETIFTTPNAIYLLKPKQLTLERIKSGQNLQDIKENWLEAYVDDNFWIVVKSWADMPEAWMIDKSLEPMANVEIVGDEEFSWNIMNLCQDYRWSMLSMEYLDEKRLVWKYKMPLGEIIIDFYDKLKWLTKGYATMNYEFIGYEDSKIVRLDILINWEKIEAFSMVVHESKAYQVWKEICEKLKTLIPKHMFSIPIQASIWAKVIARETISAMKKDVLAKCYGWDVSRKRKLLEKQKEWKKKMKAMWKVSVPSDIFIRLNTK